jgi:hypothetical protein
MLLKQLFRHKRVSSGNNHEKDAQNSQDNSREIVIRDKGGLGIERINQLASAQKGSRQSAQ